MFIVCFFQAAQVGSLTAARRVNIDVLLLPFAFVQHRLRPKNSNSFARQISNFITPKARLSFLAPRGQSGHGRTNTDSVLPSGLVIGVSSRNDSQIASGTRYCFPHFGQRNSGMAFPDQLPEQRRFIWGSCHKTHQRKLPVLPTLLGERHHF
jgi:hypothetical protein